MNLTDFNSKDYNKFKVNSGLRQVIEDYSLILGTKA